MRGPDRRRLGPLCFWVWQLTVRGLHLFTEGSRFGAYSQPVQWAVEVLVRAGRIASRSINIVTQTENGPHRGLRAVIVAGQIYFLSDITIPPPAGDRGVYCVCRRPPCTRAAGPMRLRMLLVVDRRPYADLTREARHHGDVLIDADVAAGTHVAEAAVPGVGGFVRQIAGP